ncbi:MAG: palmitoyltransferase pfa5 [Chrysothrix sp. TS-e1954]|nr:MAG: palmitoyltransferase pfa5 [Chrysothrix sp. TS-e1954]
MATDPAIHRSVNKWSARVIPFILAGLTGYVTWVFVVLICAHYLLHPAQPVAARHGAAIALLVIYFVLFALYTFSYLRVLQVVVTNPGFVRLNKSRDDEKRAYEEKGYLDRPAILDGRVIPPSGLERYISRDVYECEVDGLPRWCSTCKIWKPDRSHHCSEVNRCVYKMDHYCPWAGGIISETNFKFFVQFCTYSAFYCLYILIATSYFAAELHRKGLPSNVNWFVTIAVTALFFLFSVGIAINSLRFVFTNSTTVDDLTQRTRITHFAVLMPRSPAINEQTRHFATVTYPLPSAGPSGTANPNTQRIYAILQTAAGSNPYNLRSLMANFRTVMGLQWYEWVLPLSHSPCYMRRMAVMESTEEGHRKNAYKLGPLLDDLKSDARISDETPRRETNHRRRRRGDRRANHKREHSARASRHDKARETSSKQG